MDAGQDDNSEINGGNNRRVQKRKAAKVRFTDARRQVFLDHLAACCNVTAAAAAGVGVRTVYDARRREPGFAQAWEEAIEIGYATLEAELIARAARFQHYVPGDTEVPAPEGIDTWLAMDLLRLHRAPRSGTAKAGGRAPLVASVEETVAAIEKKLKVLARRKARAAGKGGAGAVGA